LNLGNPKYELILTLPEIVFNNGKNVNLAELYKVPCPEKYL
jgi:hypothetical protein